MSEIRSIKKTKGRKPNVFKVAGSSDVKKQKLGTKVSSTIAATIFKHQG